ncbi:MAG: benzaldehyde dehydrogenase [Acidimicrobiales bacterium]
MALLAESTWSSNIYLGGWTKGSGGDYDVVEPATGEVLGRLGLAAPEDVGKATEIAAKAQGPWAAAPYLERAAVMRRAADLFATHVEEIQRWIIRESGSVRSKADLETHIAQGECNEAAALATTPFGEILRTEVPRLSFSRRMPAGVVGVIAPFNAPLILSIRSVAPALALGNAVVLKPDTRTGVCGGVVLARVFEEAGLAPGLLHVLPGGPEVGEALVEDARVRVVSFTGSTRAGRKVAGACAKHLKRVHLELGGNSALIVMGGVDLDKAASVGAFGSFLHQGQICMTAGRHIVDASVVGEYGSLLAEHAERLEVGDPATQEVALGPIIDAAQRDRIDAMVQASVARGAHLAAGGSYQDLFYRPTVLTEVPLDAPAYAEEVFGPVAPVVAFSTPEEAVALASDTPYGLSLSILSPDAMAALELSERIPSGTVHINDQTVADEAVIPFGGVGDSGNGSRFGGARANMEAFTELQWVTAQSKLPDYPF